MSKAVIVESVDAPRFYRNIAVFMESKEQEVILAGGYETGKTFATLTKLHLLLCIFPRSRALLLRRTYKSLVNSGIVTYEQKVLPVPPDHPRSQVRKFGGEWPEFYQYPNGSRLVIGGLDNPDKVLSAEYDFINVIQAEEVPLDGWEKLTGRASGRAGNAPFTQVMGDCNPGPPTHWIKQRPTIQLLETRHEDNPRLYNHDTGEWTEHGRKTLKILDALTGVRYKRGRLGLWVAAEGQIYEYDPVAHLIKRFTIPGAWRRFRVVDFGYSNPFVCQWWAVDPDGRMIRYRELYMTQRTVRRHAEQIKLLSQGENIEATICDHDAEDRATLEENGIPTRAADKRVKVGIEKVQERLAKAGDGKPRIYFFEDSLVEVDQELKATYKPTCTEDEFATYVWASSADGKPVKEEPVKIDDHGCLVGETIVDTSSGPIELCNVRPGDYVKGRYGYVKVLWAGMTQQNARIWCVKLVNGVVLRGTGDHPVYTENKGYINTDRLRYADMLWYNSPIGGDELCYKNRTEMALRKLSFIRGINSAGIQNRKITGIRDTIVRQLLTNCAVSIFCIARYIKIALVKFHQGAKFIIKMKMHSIMNRRTLNAFPESSMRNFTKINLVKTINDAGPNGFWRKPLSRQRNGTNLPKEEGGIVNTQSVCLVKEMESNTNVIAVVENTRVKNPPTTVFVPRNVGQQLVGQAALITKRDVANDVAQSLLQTNTANRNIALVPVAAVFVTNERAPVYNLTVEHGEYYANGILVHNCDATRYAVMHVDGHSSTPATTSQVISRSSIESLLGA